MQQKKKIACPNHLKYQLNIDHVNISPQSKANRFYCSQCILDSMKKGCDPNDFLLLQEFTEDFTSYLKSENCKSNSIYAQHIQIYNNLFENDIDDLINKAKEKIYQQLEQLRGVLKPQISLRSQLKQKLRESQLSWSNLIGYAKFVQEYNSIQQSDKDATSEEWKKLEKSLEILITQSQTQQNDEFRVIYESLDQQYQLLQNEYAQSAFQILTLQDIESSLLNSISNCLTLGPIKPWLCSSEFHNEILKKIIKKVKNQQLLYKLGLDAKDHNLVWQRINGKANTLMFLKLETNEIIGAYTPAIWNSNLKNHVADNTGQSFLFSVTKQQIYPLYQKHENAIWCNDTELPCFGAGSDLCLSKEFILLYSKLGGSYQIDQYKVVDTTTHLANTKSSPIKQFEIYQLTY